jgi:hypothetical protein
MLGPAARRNAKLIDLNFTSGITSIGANFGVGMVATVGTLEPTQRTPWLW